MFWIKSRKKWLILFFALALPIAAVAGVHGYTHNMKFNALVVDMIYWSELGDNYPAITVGK